jgi:hypothetical protein
MQPKIYETPSEKTVDFVIGFVGWFILNGIFWGLAVLITSLTLNAFPVDSTNPDAFDTYTTIQNVLSTVLGCLPLLVNIGLIIFFAFRRKWIAFGMLSAFGGLLIITICLGIVATAACFVILNQY